MRRKTVNIYLHYFRQAFGKPSLNRLQYSRKPRAITHISVNWEGHISVLKLSFEPPMLPGGLPYTKGHCLGSLGRGGATGASDTQDVDRKKGKSEFMWLYSVWGGVFVCVCWQQWQSDGARSEIIASIRPPQAPQSTAILLQGLMAYEQHRHNTTSYTVTLTFKRRIKSHLPFADIIRSSPYSPRFQDTG